MSCEYSFNKFIYKKKTKVDICNLIIICRQILGKGILKKENFYRKVLETDELIGDI